ncbi:MAG: T9SS type A sorting domain-containing protein [Bacteroidota bacterium]
MTQHTIKMMALAIALLFILPEGYGQTKRYVNTNEGSCTSPDCWPGALLSLEDALNLSNSGDTIWVASGTYTPATNINGRNATFNIPSGVLVYGGFDGTESTLGERDVELNKTILSGDVNGDDAANFTNNSDNLYTIVSFSFASSQTRLDGFTVSGGNANDPTANNDQAGRSGGAIYNSRSGMNTASEPTIVNCTFSNNYALAFGGAIYNEASNFGQIHSNISYCTFSGNEAGNAGGAVYNNGSYTGDCKPTFTKCQFNNNMATVAGGAVYNDAIGGGDSSPDFIACQFQSNSALGASLTDISYAGAVYNFGKDGGLSSPNFVNCLFLRNEAFAAGCVYSLGDNGTASPQFTNCVFFRNKANQNGGAIYANAGSGTSAPVITNCIFWGNKAATIWQGDNFRLFNGTIDISHSLVDVANCGELYRGEIGSINCDASSMIFNTFPDFRDTANNDFHLLSSSVALDAGDNTAISAYPEDLDCNGRIVDGTVDLGVYEGAVAGIPLPVELLSFDAELVDDQVLLSWTTASEVQNNFFEIERSRIGDLFASIDRIEGAGNSRSLKHYTTVDRQPIEGTSYYRLKQTDLDGKVYYSGLQVIKTKTGGKIVAYPNPARAEIKLSFHDLRTKVLNYDLYNSRGQKVLGGQHEVDRKKRGQFSIGQTQQLPAGTYFLQVYDEYFDFNEQIRIIKVAE